MGTISQKDFDDYLKESSLSITEDTEESACDDDSGNSEDTCLDSAWLREVGFDFLIEAPKDSEEDEYDGVMSTLTPSQAETVRRRLQQARNTISTRHKLKSRVPDVRDVFPTIQENIQIENSKLLQRQMSSPVVADSTPSVLFRNNPGHTNSSRQSSVEEPRSVYKAENEESKKKSHWIEKNLFQRGSHKQGYKFSTTPAGIPVSGTGVQVLSYNVRSSMKRFVPPQHSDIEIEENSYSLQSFGFEIAEDGKGQTDELPEVIVHDNPLGVSRPSDLSSDDLRKMLSLALIELTSLFDHYEVDYNRRKPAKRKIRDGVFGVPLSTLVEDDRQKYHGCMVPVIFEKMLIEMESRALREEGILRKTGSIQIAENLKSLIDDRVSGKEVEQALASASPHDLAYVAKSFVRELPEPLLTDTYMDAFLQVPAFPCILEQLKALNLLVMLLPNFHRETLKRLLDFLAKVSQEENSNRMNSHSLSVIMAPNLFPPGRRASKFGQDMDMSAEVALAAISATVTKMLLKYKEVIFQVPPCILKQIRLQNEEIATNKSNKHKKRIAKRVKDEFTKPRSKSESTVLDPQSGSPPTLTSVRNTLAVQIECDRWRVLTLPIESNTSVTQFVQKALEAAGGCGQTRANGRSRVSWVEQEDTRKDLIVHCLCEIGGNIGELRLNPEAKISAVVKNNPGAEWRIRCVTAH